jgi:hypothetical protein
METAFCKYKSEVDVLSTEMNETGMLTEQRNSAMWMERGIAWRKTVFSTKFN